MSFSVDASGLGKSVLDAMLKEIQSIVKPYNVTAKLEKETIVLHGADADVKKAQEALQKKLR